MTKTINYQQLVELDACLEGLERFEAVFGTDADVPITVENCERMYFTDVEWLADSVLKPGIWDIYKRPLRARYERAHKPIRDKYERACESILDEYERAHEPIWDRYERARKSIWGIYERAHEPIWDEYMRAHKSTLAGYARVHKPIRAGYEYNFITKFCEVFNSEGIENNDQNN